MIPVNSPVIGDQEKALVSEALETGWISSEGPFVAQFEEAMAHRVGRKYGATVTNGTAALELVLSALGLEPGTEVILPTFTIISCAQAIVKAGLVPVTVDCDPRTWNMTADHVAAAITNKTQAILVVHIYGFPVDLNPVLDLARRHGLAVIEDAAEMIGQYYDGKPCGSFGDVSTMSFYANKHITTGEGGMVLANDQQLIEKVKSLRNLCFEPENRFVHKTIGNNCRFTNIQAALGLGQLQRLDKIVARKREIGRLYRACLEDLPMIQMMPDKLPYAENIYWVNGVLPMEGEDQDVLRQVRDRWVAHLTKNKIGTRPFFWPMHLQPVFKAQGFFRGVSHPVAEKLGQGGFYFPSGLSLTDEDVKFVCDCFRAATQKV